MGSPFAGVVADGGWTASLAPALSRLGARCTAGSRGCQICGKNTNPCCRAYVLRASIGVGWNHDERAYSMGNLGLLVATLATPSRRSDRPNLLAAQPFFTWRNKWQDQQ